MLTCQAASIAAQLRQTLGMNGRNVLLCAMKSFEIIAAIALALVIFFVLKVIGLVVKFALIAAVLGFVAGLILARTFRRN